MLRTLKDRLGLWAKSSEKNKNKTNLRRTYTLTQIQTHKILELSKVNEQLEKDVSLFKPNIIQEPRRNTCF